MRGAPAARGSAEAFLSICNADSHPKLIAEINTIIADHSRNDSKEEKEAIDLLKRATDALSLARAKLHEADVKKNRME